jgi:hypothetical protein
MYLCDVPLYSTAVGGVQGALRMYGQGLQKRTTHANSTRDEEEEESSIH